MLNQDQVCIVTGGGKGIGKGIAKVLAAEGATVVVAGRSEDLLRQTAADIVAGGGRAMASRLDITDRPGVTAFVQRVREQFGRIDELVNPILESKVPIQRWLRPEEIGYMVSFLASPRASGITGQMFVVDGGLDAHD